MDRSGKTTPKTLIDWLSFRRTLNFARSRALGGFVGFLVTLVGLTLLALVPILLVLMFQLSFAADHEGVRNIGLVLAALIGAPVVIWRAVVAAKQAKISEDGLYNQKITEAAGDLHARRQVTKVNAGNATDDHWEDDLQKRNAAIDRLEGLVQERPEETGRVSRLLSVYVRELSVEVPPEPEPDDRSPENFSIWASGLTARSDMELATQVLGRLRAIPGVVKTDVEIDLHGANLQGMDLHRDSKQKFGGSFDAGNFRRAKLQGANLKGARLQYADLRAARLQGGDLSEARMQGANLMSARGQAADLREARLQHANFKAARFQGACFASARLQYAEFRGSRLQKTDFVSARMQNAILHMARLQGGYLTKARLQDAVLVDARMHGASLLKSKLQGANLRAAQILGANFQKMQMDDRTILELTAFRGSSFNSLDDVTVIKLKPHWSDIFGEWAEIMPDGTPRPGHWLSIRENAFSEIYEVELEKWQRSIGQDPDDPK